MFRWQTALWMQSAKAGGGSPLSKEDLITHRRAVTLLSTPAWIWALLGGRGGMELLQRRASPYQKYKLKLL